MNLRLMYTQLCLCCSALLSGENNDRVTYWTILVIERVMLSIRHIHLLYIRTHYIRPKKKKKKKYVCLL